MRDVTHPPRTRRRRPSLRHTRCPGASAPEHRRPRRRPSAAVERRRHDLGDVQRRDLQPRRRPIDARSCGPSLPHAQRHRDHRPRLRAVGRRLRAPLPRHVCVRASGTRRAAGCCWSRDRLGVKPLYWAQRRRPRCSSPPRSRRFSRAGSSRRGRTRRCCPEVLATRYTAGTETLFEGIYKLLPGHRLVFEHGRVRVEQVPGTCRSTVPTRRSTRLGDDAADRTVPRRCSRSRCACG